MSSSICIDASLAIRALLPASQSQAAAQLLATWRDERVGLIAPALIAFEVTSSLRRLVHLAELTEAEGSDALAAFLRIGIRLSHRRDLFPLSWRLAREHGRPRAYDMAYVALAQLNDCELWTADRRLCNTVGARLPWVRWVGEVGD